MGPVPDGPTPDAPQQLPPITPETQALLTMLFNALPPKYQKWIAVGVGVVGVLAGFVVGHNLPRPVQPVNVTTEHKIDVIESPTPQPVQEKYVLFLTKDTDKAKLTADPKFKTLGIAIDAYAYNAGDGLTVVGQGWVPVPCLARVVGGKAVDAVRWTTVEDAERWIGRK
jgi:hypothetical protein